MNLIKKDVEALAPVLETGASEELPIHFLTIVLNGKPFIQYHIERFKQLPFRWHWHIVEGVAELKHDTAWALETGGRISGEIHHNGLSNDGTTEYLDKLAQEFPENITIYRKPPHQFWDGKLEMVNKPLENIQEPCLIWQVDADELWTADQLSRCRALFAAHPDRTAAYYFCHYFVGEDRVVSTRGTYGNHPEYEWLRTWRFAPGMQWTAHEPPRLCRKADGKWLDLAEIHPFTHEETEFNELVFQHYAYATPAQLHFKQIYYGYGDALSRWERLQTGNLPLQLKNYFDWVKDEAQVSSAQSQGIVPLAKKDRQGIWRFESVRAAPRPNSKRILIMRTDSIGDNVLATGLLSHLRRKYLGSHLAVFCVESAKEIYQASPFVDEVLCFNWKLSLADEDYRQLVTANVRNFKADLVINSVFSRDILSDQFVPAGTGSEIVALEGDLSNMSEGDQKRGNQFYTRLFPSPGKIKPEFERHRDLLAGLGIESKQFSTRLCPSLENRRWAEELFQEHGLDPLKTIALFPGAKYSCKIYRRYPAALCKLKGFRFLVFGGSDVTVMAEQIVDALPGSLNLCGKTTLLEMAAAMQKCRMYVGSDSSGAHIACAVGLPNLVVMGGGHFGRFFPYVSLTSVVYLPLDCYGCNWACSYKNDCIARIDPEVIFKAVRQVLASSSVKSRFFAQTSLGANFRRNKPQWASAHQWISSDKVEWIPIKQGIFKRLQTAILTLFRL